MAIALALLLIVLISVGFHLFTPWWTTPLATNWKAMDDTLLITVVITGVFFVVVNLFVVYCVWRWRHRDGDALRRQDTGDHRTLEHWLVGITAVGVAALLAPGLKVYAEYIRPPANALTVEVVGQQWQWHYRFPGASGRLGGSDARFVKAGNPLGLDPADPEGQDDRIVQGSELHLPLGQPVQVLARSHDVLHDYYVPNFRSRMNVVPGQVSSFWFTPMVAGRYESMCAQLCGVGHPNMRAIVVVEPRQAFDAWLAKQPTFADTLRAAAAAPTLSALAARGRSLAQSKGCAGCHSIDGSASVGPTWKGLYGKAETLDDGSQVKVDEDFLRSFIRDPKQRSIKGYPPVMPVIPMTDDELDALVAAIKSHAAGP
jgi:cytochrome c oxidase subunit II